MRHEALLWDKLEDNKVHCYLCAYHCKISDGSFGVCGMRENQKGKLLTYAYGNVIASNVDPIEKKPLYHFIPGTNAYSIATIGCNFKCSFCQNWNISQSSVKSGDSEGVEMTPESIVEHAIKNNCRTISYTYTEPTIFFEYAYDTAKIAKENGIYNNFVTNGYMTKETIDMMAPVIDAANIDLKSFSDETYRKVCKGRLQPVLDSIKYLKESGMWIELTTLLLPGENDSDEELKELTGFIASIDTDIPWHISRFHPDYQYVDSFPTPIETMEKARAIGIKAGLKYIYLGNVDTRGETICHGCGKVLIERSGYTASLLEDFDNGKCSACETVIPGVWE